jgi:hypothetical protein
MARHRALTTPAHPWKRTVRTALQVTLALAVMLPLLVQTVGLDPQLPWLAGVLAVAAAFARVMALPQVEAFLRRFAPWLAATDVELEKVTALVAANGYSVAGPASPLRDDPGQPAALRPPHGVAPDRRAVWQSFRQTFQRPPTVMPGQPLRPKRPLSRGSCRWWMPPARRSRIF